MHKHEMNCISVVVGGLLHLGMHVASFSIPWDMLPLWSCRPLELSHLFMHIADES